MGPEMLKLLRGVGLAVITLVNGYGQQEFRALHLQPVAHSGCMPPAVANGDRILLGFRETVSGQIELLVRPHFSRPGRTMLLGSTPGIPLVRISCPGTDVCHLDDGVPVPLNTLALRELTVDLVAERAFVMLVTGSGTLCYRTTVQDSIASGTVEVDQVVSRVMPNGVQPLGRIRYQANTHDCAPEVEASWLGPGGSRLDGFVLSRNQRTCAYRQIGSKRYRLSNVAARPSPHGPHRTHGLETVMLRENGQRIEVKVR